MLGMKMIFYVLIGAAVFAVAYLLQAFFGISMGRSSSSLEPEGFSMVRLLMQTLVGAGVGLVIGAADRWRSARKRDTEDK